MSYIKSAYLDLSKELGLAPAQDSLLVRRLDSPDLRSRPEAAGSEAKQYGKPRRDRTVPKLVMPSSPGGGD